MLAARGRLLAQLQKDGHALAKVAEPKALANRATKTLDVTYPVTAGPVVTIGPVRVAGLKSVHPGVVNRELTVHAGQRFDPAAIDQARVNLESLGVFSSVSAVAAPALGPGGTLPITFQVAEAPRHAVTIGAAYSTDLGFQGSVSWKDRNLFGNAEQLILSATNTQLGGSSSRSPGFNITAEFIKPAFLRRDQKLDILLGAIDENLQAYERRAATEAITVSRKLSPFWTASVGEAGEVERILQEQVVNHYGLVGVPLDLRYDSTNNLLDPTRGVRADLTVTPTVSFPVETGSSGGGSRTAGFALIEATASTYFDLGAPGRSVLALRGTIGTAQGARIADLPPDKRFYAGGSATVRGFKYQSVGPLFPDNNPVGGLSLDAGTVEFRQRFFKSFGAVVFVDAGQVGRSSAPFTGTLRVGTGVGVRYYTIVRADPAGFRGAGESRAGRRQVRFLHRAGTGLLMRRAVRIILWAVAVLVGLPVLLVAIVLIGANTGPGRAEIARLVGPLTGGRMVVRGVSGTFPTDLRLRHVEFRDARGTYAAGRERAARLVAPSAAVA